MSDDRAPARRPVDDTRRKIYLEVLARTGSKVAASAAATPWARSPKSCRSSFRDLAHRDPTFAEQEAAAAADALGRIEAEIVRRGVDGWERPVYQKGQLVGTERCFSDVLLLRAAQAMAPEKWCDRSKQEVKHTGAVEHHHSAAMATVTAEDILSLPEHRQQEAVELLHELREARRKRIGDGEQRRLLEAPPGHPAA